MKLAALTFSRGFDALHAAGKDSSKDVFCSMRGVSSCEVSCLQVPLVKDVCPCSSQRLPDLHRGIRTARSDGCAIGGPGQCVDRVGMSSIGHGADAGGGMPDLNRPIKPSRGNGGAIGRPGQCVDTTRVACVRTLPIAGPNITD